MQRQNCRRPAREVVLNVIHAGEVFAEIAVEKFAAMQMIDVHLPTTDGRELVLTRYTEPEPELRLLLEKLKLELPAQPPPKITAASAPPP